jgi:hypothetical protein
VRRGGCGARRPSAVGASPAFTSHRLAPAASSGPRLAVLQLAHTLLTTHAVVMSRPADAVHPRALSRAAWLAADPSARSRLPVQLISASGAALLQEEPALLCRVVATTSFRLLLHTVLAASPPHARCRARAQVAARAANMLIGSAAAAAFRVRLALDCEVPAQEQAAVAAAQAHGGA